MGWIEIGIVIGIPTSIPIPISGMMHSNRLGHLADAVC